MAKLSGARVYNSSAISLSDITVTALTFDSERYDTDAFHSTSTNTSRLTVPSDGKYIISATVAFANNATGVRQVALRVDGSTIIAIDERLAAGASNNTRITVTTIYSLTASQYVEVTAYQSSGGALNVSAVGNHTPEFMINRIG